MMGRRSMLRALVAASGAAILPLAPLSVAGQRRIPWQNWSGSQRCEPAARVAPDSVESLQALLRESQGTVRPVGAGHSFMPLVPTDGTIVSLSRMEGVIDHDPETQQATVWAGSRLGALGQPLEDVGQALINMPDIDEQALAGCLATATHGTGAGIGCMSSFVTGLQLVDARGNLWQCSKSENPDIFEAARVSLGALGIITQVTLQNTAPYRLRREAVWREFDEILAVADAMADKHRNFEFFYIPFSGMGFTDVHDLTTEPVSSTERLDGNSAVLDLRLARDWLEWSPSVRELILGSYMKTLDDEVVVENSWKNYASERNVRFNEMEYHLPREHGLRAMSEVRDALESQHHEVFFPIEFRYIAADDLWLSPFHGRPSCSIAVHRIFDEDFEPYFQTIEPIFRKYGGRPHWGKLNTLTAEDFAGMYPRWNDFNAIRRDLDPEGRFLNPYLANLFA